MPPSRSLPAAVSQMVHTRPSPPYGLPKEEAKIWYDIVNSLPSDYFDARTHFLLERLCRHLVASEREIEQLEMNINELEGLDKVKALPLIGKIRALHERTSIALCMRLKLMKPYSHAQKSDQVATRQSLKVSVPVAPWLVPGRNNSGDEEHRSGFSDDSGESTYPRQ